MVQNGTTKVLAAPDLHCFYGDYDFPVSGKSWREAEWKACAARILEVASEREVDVALLPGDFFVTAKPDPLQILMVADLLRELDRRNVVTVGCLGNHDDPGPGRISILEVLKKLRTVNVILCEKPETVELFNGRIGVAVLPSAKPRALAEENGEQANLLSATEAALSAIVSKLAFDIRECRFKILLAHWGAGNSTLGNGESLLGREPLLDLNQIATLFNLAVLGHIHKPQMLREAPPIVHPGNLVRKDFGEEGDGRGFFVFELESGKGSWFDVPARQFVTLTEKDASADVSRLKEAVVRIKAPAGFDPEPLARKLLEEGVFCFAGCQVEAASGERVRAEGLSEGTDPLEALRTWLEVRGFEQEKKEAVMAKATALLREVA